ncbi:MAG TPA: hypothetical protein VK652_06045 [Steroidobacteraceae bacterium]|nr:hypothetical protein [Steroidobacteraceae bacterium]
MAALAPTLHDRPEKAAVRLRRPGVLLFVAALHAALLFLASQWQTRVTLRREEPLVFLTLPSRMQAPAAETEPPPQPSPQKKPPPSHDTQLVIVPPPAEPQPVEQPAAPIDWSAEAVRTAKQQAELAAAPGPRALDQPGAAGLYFDGGLGPDPEYRPEFGWDHAHIRRIEALEGGGTILWINDRCFIVMAGVIPFPMCGIGKIPPRADLFDHMRDPPPAPSQPNIAP